MPHKNAINSDACEKTVALFHQSICGLFANWLIRKAAHDVLQEKDVFFKIVLSIAGTFFSDDRYLIKKLYAYFERVSS